MRPGTETRRLGPALEFLQTIWALLHALERASRSMESRLGVTGQQRFVVRLIGGLPDVTPGELAEALHIDPSTVTGLLKRAERRGLVTRQRHAGDGRRQSLVLTERGRRMNAESEGTIEGAVREALRRMPPSKIGATREVMQALIAALAPVGEATARPRPRRARR